jgi:hypothetical protein
MEGDDLYTDGGAPTANNFQLMGTSGLIMSWDRFTPDDLNQIGAETPFNVYLYR